MAKSSPMKDLDMIWIFFIQIIYTNHLKLQISSFQRALKNMCCCLSFRGQVRETFVIEKYNIFIDNSSAELFFVYFMEK